MAHNDYISRKNTPKKNPYKKNQEPPENKFSLKHKVILLIILILAGSFAYFLWVIKDKTPINAQPQNKQTLVEQKPKVVLPEKHEEKWDFMQDLKNKNVEQSEYNIESNNHPKPYQVRCASFKSSERAESLKAQIAFTGLSAKVKKIGSWYRVFIDGYQNKREAQNDINKLKQNKIYCKIF